MYSYEVLYQQRKQRNFIAMGGRVFSWSFFWKNICSSLIVIQKVNNGFALYYSRFANLLFLFQVSGTNNFFSVSLSSFIYLLFTWWLIILSSVLTSLLILRNTHSTRDHLSTDDTTKHPEGSLETKCGKSLVDQNIFIKQNPPHTAEDSAIKVEI